MKQTEPLDKEHLLTGQQLFYQDKPDMTNLMMLVEVTFTYDNETVTGATPSNTTVAHPALQKTLLAVKLLLTVSCILINLVGLIVIVYGRLYKKNMYLLVMYLTVNDFLMGAFHLPLSIHLGQVGASADQTTLCSIFAVSVGFFPPISLLGLTIYNTDRYIAIRWPYYYIAYVSKTRLSVAWGFGVICVTIVKTIKTFTAPAVRYQPEYETCAGVSGKDRNFPIRFIPEMCFAVTCYVIVLGTSYHLSRIIKQQREAMEAQDRVSGREINRADASTLLAFQSVGLLSMLFLITGLPRLILFIIPVRFLPPGLPVVMIWLVYCNGIFNVLVYGYKFKAFRRSFLKLIRSSRRRVYENRVEPVEPSTSRINSISLASFDLNNLALFRFEPDHA